MRALAPLLLAAIAGAALPARVSAQTAEPRLDISGGVLFLSGHQLAGEDANLTRNQVNGDPFTLFQSAARVEGAAGLEARIGWRLTGRLAVEGGVLFSRPRLTARISSDVEGIPDATLEETLSRYIIDGAVRFHLPPLGGGRVTPFLRAGAGYLRELHDDNVLVETGQVYHAGGGVSVWFGQRRRTGLRLDGRVLFLNGGADLGKGLRAAGAAGAALVVGF